MPPQELHLKALIVIAVVFVSVAAVHLLLGSADEEGELIEGDGATPTMQITRQGEEVDLVPDVAMTPQESIELLREQMAQLTTAEGPKQRAAAIQLRFMANDPERQECLKELGARSVAEMESALLRCLSSEDETVSQNCRDALIGLWRMPERGSAPQLYAKGLDAYQQGAWEKALAAFASLEKTWGELPPDLWRLRGEMLLRKGRADEAIAACRRAVELEPKHFVAYYVLTQAYESEGERGRAMKALDAALRVYPTYPEALELRGELAANAL